ncbi:MAG: PAS domain S-box protein [Sphingobacteriales bacterium]|nr:MAG: PAS domain S-box protein [Sphingobacteriales bacterium]
MNAAAFPTIASGDFHQIFELVPAPFLVIKADAPVFTIADANNAYLHATFTDKDSIIGKGIFDIFPGSPEDSSEITGVERLRLSLNKVLATHKPHKLDTIRYDISVPDGSFIERYWNATNIPVMEGSAVKYIVHTVEDITNKVLQDRADIESLDRFRSMVMQAPIAMGVLRGRDMVIESANHALLELWGKTKDVIGLPLLQGLPEIEGQPFPLLLMQVMETGEPYHGYEAKAMLTRNGVLEECYFNFVYAPYREDNGIITGVTVTASEVTGQVRTKKELQISEKRFRNFVTEADVATAVYRGEDMVIELANDAMLKLWGKDDTVIGKKLEQALPELEGQPFMDLLRSVYTTGNTYKATEDRADLIIDGVLQSGYFNFSYKALRDAEGNIYGILNMAVDVTDLVLERRKLKESEQRLKIATEGTGVATWDLNLKTKDIIYTPRLNEIFGHPHNTVLTHPEMKTQVLAEDLHLLDKAFEKAVHTGIYGYEARIRWADNSIHWIRTQGRVIFDQDGTPARMLGIMVDITEQKETSEQLRASEEKYRTLAAELEQRVLERTNDLEAANAELVRSNDELEQFAFITSHDLQEPLRKIRTFSNMLSEQDKDKLSDRGRSYLDKVSISAQRMSELIKALLNFSRLRVSQEEFQSVDLNRVLDDVLIDFELLIKQKNARVVNEGLPVIEGIPLQMNQLFYNLLSNALKFTNPELVPRVVLSSHRLSPSELQGYPMLNPAYDFVEIIVADNGIGFGQEYADKVFEIFQRLHDRNTYEGTGIGLALCNKIVMNHKGQISARSEEGAGASFHIILPVRQ